MQQKFTYNIQQSKIRQYTFIVINIISQKKNIPPKVFKNKMTQPNLFQSCAQVNLIKKQQSSVNPIRICNCPCIAQIQQNQKMIQLQREYTKTLELQNLRRNQQRYSLQAEINNLRLELEQPYKEKQQLKQKIQYFRKLYQQTGNKLKISDKQVSANNKSIVELKDQIVSIKNEKQRLNSQNELNLSHLEQLKAKLSQIYQNMNMSIPKQRRSSLLILNKNQQPTIDIIQKFQKKWGNYRQEIQKKNTEEIKKMQIKNKQQIDSLVGKIKDLQNKLKQKTMDLNILLHDQKGLRQKAINSENQIKTLKLIKDTEIQNKINGTKSIYEQRIHNLNQTVEELQDKLNKSQLRENQLRREIQQKAKQNIKSNLSKQVQTLDPYLIANIEQNPKFIALTYKYQQKLSQLKQKDQQIFKLQKRLQSLSKVRQLFEQKQKQLKIHRDQSLRYSSNSGDSWGSLRQSKNNLQTRNYTDIMKLIENDQNLKNVLIRSLLSQSSQSMAETAIRLQLMEEQLRQKHQQIICLQQANSSLKKLKIQSLDNDVKISALQKQNSQLRKRLGFSSNQKVDISRTGRSDIKNNTFTKSSISNYCRRNDNSHLNLIKKSMIQVRNPYHNERSYLTYKNSQTLKSSDSQANQFMLLQALGSNKDGVKCDGVKFDGDNRNHNRQQGFNEIKSRVLRHDSHDIQINQQRKRVNFCLQVPKNSQFRAKSQSEQNVNIQRGFNI